MLRRSKTLFFFISLFFLNISNCINAQTNLDSVFIDWNKATFQSLKQELVTPNGIKKKDLYENRFEAFKAYLEIDSIGSVNRKSIRYAFLNTLFSECNCEKSDLYIIEADEEGYMMTIRNFVVYLDSMHIPNVEFYTFIDGKWDLKGSGQINSFIDKNDLRDHVVDFGRGFNHDDVIITRFENAKAKESEYYLLYTLSGQSGFKAFIDSYRTISFIK